MPFHVAERVSENRAFHLSQPPHLTTDTICDAISGIVPSRSRQLEWCSLLSERVVKSAALTISDETWKINIKLPRWVDLKASYRELQVETQKCARFMTMSRKIMKLKRKDAPGSFQQKGKNVALVPCIFLILILQSIHFFWNSSQHILNTCFVAKGIKICDELCFDDLLRATPKRWCFDDLLRATPTDVGWKSWFRSSCLFVGESLRQVSPDLLPMCGTQGVTQEMSADSWVVSESQTAHHSCLMPRWEAGMLLRKDPSPSW